MPKNVSTRILLISFKLISIAVKIQETIFIFKVTNTYAMISEDISFINGYKMVVKMNDLTWGI